jgi:hypothetical protein
MAGVRESTAQGTYEYETEPAVVAQVCQEVLAELGSVKQVSRETGTIYGKIKVGWMDNAEAVIQICRKDTGTELRVNTTKGEAILTSGGAQKALTLFMSSVGQDKRLAAKSKAGW